MAINEVICEWYGKKAGTKEALSVYQKAVCRVVKQLTEEEWEEVEWNLDCGPPNDVKARLLLWQAGHKRMHYNGDFNDEIARGEKFQGVQKISAAWNKYIDTHYTSDSEEESNPKPKLKQKRPDPTIQVMYKDGSIWIGKLAGRVACACPKVVAPFKKLPQHINAMMESENLPLDFQFSGDPSHMRTSEALHFLEFIQGHQKDHPDDIFKFHHWIDENGDLQESVKGESEAGCNNEDRIEAHGSTSSTEQPTREGEG
ncbi:hypothetical protein BS17DRAFT_765988 [Gyrodon lividus]|nr:hypothetical protein BS17DRAFT_765988 [Gyrodon lividus]